MLIGVISDTHVPEAGPDLPPEAYDALGACDLILHCGDMHGLVVLDRLQLIAPVFAARGNGDTFFPFGRRPGVPEDPRVAESRILELEGFRIGLTHDLEAAEGRSEEFADSLIQRVFGQPIDIALCGHTHVPLAWGLSSGTTILNPGSPTMPYGYTNIVGTVGHLRVSARTFEFRVIDLLSGAVQVNLKGPGIVDFQKGPRPSWR